MKFVTCSCNSISAICQTILILLSLFFFLIFYVIFWVHVHSNTCVYAYGNVGEVGKGDGRSRSLFRGIPHGPWYNSCPLLYPFSTSTALWIPPSCKKRWGRSLKRSWSDYGPDPTKPLLMAIKVQIYDVSQRNSKFSFSPLCCCWCFCVCYCCCLVGKSYFIWLVCSHTHLHHTSLLILSRWPWITLALEVEREVLTTEL